MSQNIIKSLQCRILIFIGILIFSSAIFAQTDTEFWFAVPEVTSNHEDEPLRFFFCNPDPVNPVNQVKISIPSLSQTLSTVSVPPGGSTIVDVTIYKSLLENDLADTVLNRGISIEASDLVSAYYWVGSTKNSAMFNLKGISGLGFTFYIPSQNNFENNINSYISPFPYNSFDIVATEDNTIVTITPTNTIYGRSGTQHVAGIPYQVVLNCGQTYSARALSGLGPDHLTGTKVTSTKKIAITYKDDSIWSKKYLTGSDLIGDQIIPKEYLDTAYVVIRGYRESIQPELNDWIYIISASDNNMVWINGVPIGTPLNSGEYYSFIMLPTDTMALIQSDSAVTVMHLSGRIFTSGGSVKSSEFACSVIPPVSLSCSGNSGVSFYRNSKHFFAVFLLSDISAQSDFYLDGNNISSTYFNPVPGTSYVYARIEYDSISVPIGSHRITNSVGSFHFAFLDMSQPDTTFQNSSQYGYLSNFVRIPNLFGEDTICQGVEMTYYTDTLMNGYTWEVTGGIITAGGTLIDNFVTVLWNNPGNQQVSVNYSDPNGCPVAGPSIMNVVVNSLPLPSLTGPSSACLNSTGNIYTSDASMTNYLWIISSGGTITSGGSSADDFVTLTWNTTGAQSVSVNYTDQNGCTATTPTVLSVMVNSLPVPILTGPATACINSTGNIYSTTAGMTNYTWNVSAGGTITAGGGPGNSTVTITWNTAEPQSVSINYSDLNGCTAAAPTILPVTVNLLPVPVLTGPATVCVNSTGNIYSTTAGMTNYVWSVSAGGAITAGGGTADNSSTITWSTAGPQSVSVNYTDPNGCTAVSPTIFSVTVNPLPVPTLNGPSPVCVNSTGNVYSTDPGMTNYTWNLTAGGTGTAGGGSTDNTMTVTWNSTGAEEVSVNYTDLNGCTASVPSIFPVTVNPRPILSIAGPGSVCLNSNGNVYSTNSGMTNYIWTVSAGGTITAGGSSQDYTITVTWNTSGSQSVSINYTDPNGCSALIPLIMNVAVHPLPVPGITGLTLLCAGTTGVTYSTEAGMTGYTWLISPSGTITSGAGTDMITVTWNDAGAQWISVNYTDGNGCTAASPTIKNVTVYPLPIPTISGPASVCEGNSGVIYSTDMLMTGYIWNISASGTITGGAGTNTVTVTWNTSGSQWISVSYTDGNGCTAANPTVMSVTVNPLPVPTITGASSVCTGASGIIYSTEPFMTGYNWDISSGGTITGGAGTNTVTVTWNTSGSHWISVNYTDGNGCSASNAIIKTVMVNVLPVPTITGSSPVCEGVSGVVYTTESMMTGYTWSISAGGTITDGIGTNSVTVTWNSAGTQWISVNYLDGNGCTAVIPTVKNVIVNPLPVPTITGVVIVCEATAGVSYSTEPLMTGYIWNISAGGTITSGAGTNIITVTWNTAGSQWISVRYTDGNGCIAASATVRNVTVNPLPVPTVSGPSSICVNSTANVYSTETGMTSYVWNVSSGGTITAGGGSSDNTVMVTWNTPGAQSVSVNYTSFNGCSALVPTVLNVTVNPLPVPTITGNSSVCMGASGMIYSTQTGMTGYAWTISPGGTITSGNGTDQITVTWNMSGLQSVSVTYTNANGCTAMTPTVLNVSVNPRPVPTITGATTVCVDSSGVTYTTEPGMTGYTWTISAGGVITSGFGTDQITVNWIAPGPQTISVNYFDSHGCTALTPTLLIVTVDPLPPVEFTWSIGSQNNEIQFQLDTVLTPIGMIGNMIEWNFGDGTYATGIYDPLHVYPVAGNFNVIVTVTDTIGCSNMVQHTVTVPSVPFALFSSNSPQCLGQPICFTDLSSVPTPPFGWIVTWIWNYGDGSPNDTIYFPNLPNVCHNYTTLDTFAVTLTVYDNFGYTDDYTSNVITLADPVANYFYSTACQNQVVQFTDYSSPNGGGNLISWDWNFGDPGSGINNTSGMQNPVHTYAYGDSTYTVRLVVRNFNDCSDTIYKDVYVFPSPPVDFLHDTACLNNLVHFWADTAVLYVDSIAAWAWNFGDGTPIVTDPVSTTHLYALPGTYTVTLTVTDHRGCKNTIAHTVEVNPEPVANFGWLTPVCQNVAVQFTDYSYIPSPYTGFIARWHWEFGDGTDTTILFPASPNVIHLYQGAAVSYVVRLTVWSNDSCDMFIEKTVNLIPAPIANFEYSSTSCENQAVQFTDLSQDNGGGSVVAWYWNFDDPPSGMNNTSTLQNPLHTFTTPGTYDVMLIATNGNGCRDTIVKPVVVNLKPIANFMADTACLGTPTVFTDLSIPNSESIVSYLWDFGDGTPPSPQPNPTHIYATYGIKTVTLTIVNSNGCVNDTTKLVLVNPLPIAEFSYTTPNCLGSAVQYTDLSSTITGYLGQIIKWEWSFGDGTPNQIIWYPTSPNVSHVFAGTATSHTVRLTVTTNDSCTHWVEHVVNSIPAPLANFQFPATSCESQVTQFTDLSQPNGGGNIISWHWNFGDPASGGNNISTAQNPTHTFTNTGTFNVTLIVNNASNCSDTIVKAVAVSMQPIANFTADTACLGNPTVFTDLSIGNAPSIVAYNWDFGDGTPPSTLTNPTHTYATYGLKTVTLTIVNSNGCTRDTSRQVLVLPLPVAEFTFTTPNCLGAPVQYTNQSTTIPGYSSMIIKWVWNFGDGTPPQTIWYPANPNVSHVFAGSATSHIVRLTVTTGDSCIHFKEHLVTSIPQPIANFGFPPNNCASQTTQFTDLSQQNGGGLINSWFWDFGDPLSGINNTSTAQNPVHIFTGSGTFNVMLIVANASSCSDTIVKAVNILARPVANFTCDTVCKGSVTQFTDQSTASSGTIASWYWQFGDGGTSTIQNPTHLYAAAGTYQVNLKVTTSEGCYKDTTKTAIVWGQPTANFSYTSPSCAGDSVHFTDLSVSPHGSIQQWVWNFGDGTPPVTVNFPANPNVTHAYAMGGTYNVTLSITTSDDCTAQKTKPVSIDYAPLANFTNGYNACALVPLQFTDLSQTNGGQAIIQWYWDFDDPASGTNNNSTLQNPLHAFSTGGTFNVNLTVTNATGCIDSITKSVAVNDAPVANFTADTACMTFPTQFTDASTTSSGTIVGWLWDFGDPASGSNNSSTQQNPTHIYNANGTYYVTLQVTNSNQCVNDTTMEIIVYPIPNAMFSYQPACVGDPTQFTDLSTAPGSQITGWYWDFGDGIGTSTSQNPTYVYTIPGVYDVTLTVTNLSGCQDSLTQPVIARPTPTAAYTYQNFYCPAGRVDFQDQSTGSGAAIVERLWIFEPGYTSSLPNPTYIFGVTDTTYLVTLIVTDNYGCMDTVIDSVYVKPGFEFTFTFDSVCHGYKTHFTSINLTPGDTIYSPYWNFGDPNSGPNNVSYLRNPTHTFTQPGIYSVKLRVYNSDNCADSIYRDVRVWEPPQPHFAFVTQPCDSTIYFYDTTNLSGSGPIAQWEWHFGDGTPPVIIPAPGPGDTSHLYVNTGIYQVTLIITNSSGCIDSITQSVQRLPCIQAAYSYQDTLRCMNYPVVFLDTSHPVNKIVTWYWDWDDGQDTTYTTYATNLIHTYTMYGTYDVKLTIHALVDGVDIADSTIKQVVIHPTPETYFSNLAMCLNQTTVFHDTSETYGEPVINWSWNFGEPSSGPNNTSIIKDPTHTYASRDTFDVRLVVMNRFGCKDSLTKSTRIYGLPEAHFDNTVACMGDATYFYDMTLASDTIMRYWHWDFGDITWNDTSHLQNPVYKYPDAGNYAVQLIVTDYFGCMDTVDSTVTVNITPVSVFTITENFDGKPGRLKLNNESTGANGYLWDFGNGKTSTEENPIAIYVEDGTYIIKLIALNEFDCSDTTFFEYELLFKGLFIPNAFAPASTDLGIRLFKPVGINLKQYHIQVFDQWGTLMWESTKIDSGGHPEEGWDGVYRNILMPQGTYMWKVKATFIDDTPWTGSDIGQGDYKTIGTVTLIR